MSHSLSRHECEVCGKEFASKRFDAKTCSAKCRAQKSRGIKSGQGRGWYAVRPYYVQMYAEFAGIVGDNTISGIQAILENFGASAAEWAIVAVADVALSLALEIEKAR